MYHSRSTDLLQQVIVSQTLNYYLIKELRGAVEAEQRLMGAKCCYGKRVMHFLKNLMPILAQYVT